MSEEIPKIDNRVNEVSGTGKLGLFLLGGLLKLWQSTLTYTYSKKDFTVLTENEEGCILLLWHNRIFASLGIFRQLELAGDNIHALVSASKDGAVLASFMRAIGMVPVRGSSSRRAQQATRELFSLLNRKKMIAITVDGPRGPCYEAQAGAAMLALRSNKPVYILGSEPNAYWRLKSWDRFFIPKPFSEVHIKIDRIKDLPSEKSKEGRDAVREVIQEQMMQMTGIL